MTALMLRATTLRRHPREGGDPYSFHRKTAVWIPGQARDDGEGGAGVGAMATTAHIEASSERLVPCNS